MEIHGHREGYSISQTFQTFRRKSPNGPLKSKRVDSEKTQL